MKLNHSDHLTSLLVFCLLIIFSSAQCRAVEIVVATVDNADMLNMKKLSSYFEQQNKDINIRWKIVDESVLRLMQANDSKLSNAQYDVYTLGLFEAPIWGSKGRLSPVPDQYKSDHEMKSWIPEIIEGFSYGGDYYALPYYGESSITYYRKDVLERFNLQIPPQPTWRDIDATLELLKRVSGGQNGRLCLRGKPGWGENIVILATMLNGFGGRWYDENWQSALSEKPWKDTIEFYLGLMEKYGLETPWDNGYSENLQAFVSGQCDIWVDSTAAGGAIAQSKFYQQVGYAAAPSQLTDRGTNWLWSWGFAVPQGSTKKEAAWRFVKWATSDNYHQLVENNFGISQVPPGTRYALYQNPSYREYAKFADITLKAIKSADFENPSAKPVPYRGIQFLQVEEFQQIGNFIGKKLAFMLEKKLTGGTFNLDRELARMSEFVQASHNIAERLRQKGVDAY
ncbi:sugar ABC transporter substrate-binding protein [Hahella sp. CCB-MM4]|uniref:extracellular solute-binding protein n=1 Tax=Hahella sp. (strain CCB-MM4) TaxID=1926491 RepID=UPI000B9A8AD3|nr:extracellular solute-binding protein [Hahella sp. CCB-MM4]OZG70169.1 sugar ABC transporter substrate-binding protein [Hahella sp. CCB-MM4]